MSSKRPGGNLGSLLSKKSKEDARTPAASKNTSHSNSSRSNPYLRHPVDPAKTLHIFLTQARNDARRINKNPKEPFCEIEARMGILKAPYGAQEMRVTPGGPKTIQGRTAHAFDCTTVEPRAAYESGITRTHYVKWTQAGLSEVSPLSQALGVKEDTQLRRDIVEKEYVETVYGGYPQERRCVYSGLHPSPTASPTGKMEHKERLSVRDLSVPAAMYDIRIQLATEKADDHNIGSTPPHGWTSRRIKRRRSYSRADKSIKWQIDVTEVTTTYRDANKQPDVTYELEMELHANTMLQLASSDEASANKLTMSLAQQLWWILSQLNPESDVLDVEEFLRDHPSAAESQLALAQCGALKSYLDGKGNKEYYSPIGKSGPPSPALSNVNFVGCMPVNFSRHNIEEVQRSAENGYFLSEKTDGVRHFLIFTGKTAVLVDRAMRGKQPVPRGDSKEDPFAFLLHLIQPGTVLDGEVVMHRKLRRPIFIVFDVLALNTTSPVLHLPFEQRLKHLRQASFRTRSADRDMFDPKLIHNKKIALPLIRKNFVKRQQLDALLSKVTEERGMRTYRSEDSHNHLTDGIIFQPNSPYVCGTDRGLLKWKYLDTVTIDVEILPLTHRDSDDVLRVGVLGEDNTRVDMTRHLHLPHSERRRLEADRAESGSKIAEVGFDPTTGEWYYLTMRPDKIAPNHISTVLGTLLELAESLTTEELRYRMSVPPGTRDTYRKDVRGMQRQLLDHQRRKNQQQRQQHR